MMDRRTWLILILACLAAAGGWWLQYRAAHALPDQPAARAGVTPLSIGDSASAYSLPDLEGQPTTLAKWHGKAVLLNFWASWCVPCLQEMPMLAAFQREHAAEGLQVVGVAMEQPQSAAAYLKHLPVGYPILVGIDADPVPTTIFGDTGGMLPYSVLIDRTGHIRATKLGTLDATTLKDWLAQAAAPAP